MSPLVDQAHSRGDLRLVYAGESLNASTVRELQDEYGKIGQLSLSQLEEFLSNQSFQNLPDFILIESDPLGACFATIELIKKNPIWNKLIIVLLSAQVDKEDKNKALQLKLHDFYTYPFPMEHLLERLNFLAKFRMTKPILEDLQSVDLTYKTPRSKRLFDLIVSIAAVTILSPILLIIALLIKIDSKGPIIYKSKRVGTGYKIFNFYKFRSMRTDADKQLNDLTGLNQYAASSTEQNESTVFVKIKDDPRITRIGKFLRNTSIDELPQLFNVIKGEMSLVGNRPLPLYEAELLTSNEWSMRFLGPAGVTGLWQTSRRGNKIVSASERKRLDNFYAMKYSFGMDLMILFKTIPALFQKENV